MKKLILKKKISINKNSRPTWKKPSKKSKLKNFGFSSRRYFEKKNLRLPHRQFAEWKFYHFNGYMRYIWRYKKVRGRIFWRRRWVRSGLLRWFKFFKSTKALFKRTTYCHRKRSDYGNNRRISAFTNFQKLWVSLFYDIRQFANYQMRPTLTPYWKKFRRFTGNFRLNYPQFQVWHLRRQKYWQKLRKRWIWHRLIKRSVKVKFLSNLKKYFSYNIAIRKYFKTILPSYSLHEKVMYQQVPYFLVQMRLVPVLKHAIKLCRANRVMVNGKAASPSHIIQPFDIVRFNFRKKEIFWKQRWHFHRRYHSKGFRLRKGLIYNRRFKFYIFYKDLKQIGGRKKIAYLYYYYFYRNLLQTCRMQ